MWHPKSVKVIVIPVAVLVVGLALCAATLVIALGVRPAAAGPNANPGAPNPGHAWTEIENHGTSGSPVNTYWLGTTGNQALELEVNGVRALRLEPNSTSPNVIGGYSGNSVTAGVLGAAIGGGGRSLYPNRVTTDYATVGGGLANAANGPASTVGGGLGNNASGNLSTVGGGGQNISSGTNSTVGGGAGNISGGFNSTVGGGSGNATSGWSSTVGGGNNNTASADFATIAGGGATDTVNPSTGNRVTDNYGTVGGGGNNQAGDGGDTTSSIYATVAGGNGNTASSSYATVGGGWANQATGTDAAAGGGVGNQASGGNATVGGGFYNTASSSNATVGGGEYNKAITGDFATVGGGYGNTASGGTSATVAGGWSNTASGITSTVGGGLSNTASGYASTVGGGDSNQALGGDATVGGGQGNTASGSYATVPGGYFNVAAGDYSFAAGYNAQANYPGAFVWADSTGSSFPSSAANTFQVRASGGTCFFSNPAGTVGACMSAGGNAFAPVSDRNVKANFSSVDGQDILNRLASIPVETWNLKSEDPSIRHMGPMAQDFYAAFGLGEDNLHISTVDADGVALAGIQGLYQLSQEQASRIQALEDENATLTQRLDDLETRVTALEGANGTSNSASAGPFSSSLSIGWLPIGGLLVAGLVLVQRRRTGGKR